MLNKNICMILYFNHWDSRIDRHKNLRDLSQLFLNLIQSDHEGTWRIFVSYSDRIASPEQPSEAMLFTIQVNLGCFYKF